jgi:hypothetical protein
MTISIIKLSSGETVLADVLSYSDDTYDLEVLNPLQVQMNEDVRSLKMQMFTSAWIPLFGEETVVEIRFAHIIAVAEAPEEMVNYYLDSLNEMKIKEDTREEIQGKVMQEILKMANTSIH